ncbi:MAG: NAD(P)H-hydrate dehydratase [Phycisphaerales bacterium]|nr:NAD(P)H-hydrate dehydratase [Phycisphaerales bacterium]
MNGRVVIFAGSPGMSGAAVLCARGALRGGAGLVRVCAPSTVQSVIAAAEPCVMTCALMDSPLAELTPDVARQAFELVEWADVVAVGPGLGQSSGATELVSEIIKNSGRPLVVDADGLNALSKISDWWSQRPTADGCGSLIVTPHPGEFERLARGAGLPPLSGESDAARIAAAAAYAERADCVVVLKGHRTVVTDAKRVYVNRSGNPGMATGGMGDVLTGLIAALLGQGLAAFDAAQLGVHCHSAAADALVDAVGPIGYLASEVADAIPTALSLHIC